MFEFVIYLPFLMIFFNIFVSISGSINASINQVKATRGYFFHIVKGNPNIPKRTDVLGNGGIKENGLTHASMFSVGWREKKSGESSFLTCYKIKPFGTTEIDEQCDQSAPDPRKTFLVRVGSVFGVCGATYAANGDVFHMAMSLPGDCIMRK